jgi:hypothetical protein
LDDPPQLPDAGTTQAHRQAPANTGNNRLQPQNNFD